jgi:hypothetical protein
VLAVQRVAVVDAAARPGKADAPARQGRP